MAGEAILEAVRRNVRRPGLVLPPFLSANLPAVAGYEGEPPVAHFVRRLEALGGRSVEIADATAAANVVVIRSPLGVAEAGAVWLTEADLVVNALGVLSQHLVVLLDPAAIVPTMHDACARIYLAGSPYGVFMAGPSATGDVEGVIVHRAQSARSLAVLLCPERTPSQRTAMRAHRR
jgi:LUD domain